MGEKGISFESVFISNMHRDLTLDTKNYSAVCFSTFHNLKKNKASIYSSDNLGIIIFVFQIFLLLI